MTEEAKYLIKKGGYFYRPNCQGYTNFKFDAGRYTKEHAEAEASVEPWHMSAIHEDDVPDTQDPDKFIAGLQAEVAELKRQLATAQKSGEPSNATTNVSPPVRYEARGNVVHKLPVKVRNETDTNTTFEVGFPACTASEYVEATAIAALLDRGERVLEAAGGIADDFMTSEHHHPGYVLIPTAKFEAIRTASGRMDNETPTPPGNQIRTAECDGKDAVPVTGLLPIGTASTPAVMTDEAVSLYSETTPGDGVIRLARWPEGYVLWFHGKIVWRSWVSDQQARAEMLRKVEGVLSIPSAGHASAGEIADTILDALGCTEGSTDA